MSSAFGEPPCSGPIPLAEARDAKASESTRAPARTTPITLRRLGTGKARAIITTGLALQSALLLSGKWLYRSLIADRRSLDQIQACDFSAPVGEGAVGQVPAHFGLRGQADPAQVGVVAEAAGPGCGRALVLEPRAGR